MNKIESLPTKRDMVSILGKDFFKEETICEYLVTEKMKKIWAVNLDIYLEFVKICEKYNLRHYAYAGTLLGAIRHKGFVPWDDDMDVCMPRVDYERFLKVAPKELENPFFLQTPFSEQGYYRTMTRLSNIKTTRLLSYYRHSGMSHGLMLDIFPLDNCNPATIDQEIKKILFFAKRCSQYMKRNDTEIMTPSHFISWKENMTDSPMEDWQAVQRIAMQELHEETDYFSMKVLVLPNNSGYNSPIKKEWFSTSQKVKFEGIEIQIPCGFDSFLTATYGNYMQFPPVEQRGTWHGGLVIDPERPYTYYQKMNSEEFSRYIV